MKVSCRFILLVALALAPVAEAKLVSLDLKNGDHVSGALLAEKADRLVVSNQWSTALEIPLSEIQQRHEAGRPAAPLPAQPLITGTVMPAAKPAAPNTKPVWKTDAEIGLDMAYGVGDHQTFYGKLHENYTHPYTDDPQQSTRLDFKYVADYGHTDHQLSANDMLGSQQSEFDLNRKIFINDELSAGYDRVRKIDLQYAMGPGLGYHLLATPVMKLNTSAGVTYQVQEGDDGAANDDFYLRLAEDYKWDINQRLELDDKLEYFPLVQDFDRFRARFEVNLRYKFLQHLSLNLTLQDYYDSHPADGVSKNELKIRSSLGIAF